MMESLRHYLYRSVDASSLAMFRIGFGLILLTECFRYQFKFCIQCYWNVPDVMFKYYGFGWVHPLPAPGMDILWGLMGLAAIGITLGWYYRFCMVFFTIAFCYSFLQDQSLYLNHFYLVILFACIMCVVPANRFMAVDAWRRPTIASATIPYWPIFLLRAQLEIVLIFAGLVKINHDWLNLEPLRMWLAQSADLPVMGALFVQDWAVAVAAYGVIALHLVGAPLLLFRKTRLVVLFIYASFHTLNHFVFNIGIFPWFTLYASLIFFDPDWPRQLYAWTRDKWPRLGLKPWLAAQTQEASPPASSSSHAPAVVGLLAIWLAIQILFPMRHFLMPGNVAWNEAGHRFSWRMKLRDKDGEGRFQVVYESGERETINPARYLTPLQVGEVYCIPDIALQFAHYLAEVYETDERSVSGVYATTLCALNGRPYQHFIDSQVNLLEEKRTTGHFDWVIELDRPLPDPWLGSDNEYD